MQNWHHNTSVSFALDKGFADCTLVSAHSVARHIHGSVHFNFLCTSKIEGFERNLSSVFSHLEYVTYTIIVVDPSQHFETTKKHISGATLLRLTLHKYVNERTIYLDGDTLVREDISELGYMDLEGNLVAACLGPSVAKSRAARKSWNPMHWRPSRLKSSSYLEQIGISDPLQSYFNAGVMAMDLPAIRKMDNLSALEDIQKAVSYKLRDQDHLNLVFHGKCKILNPTWNSVWGNAKMIKSPLPKEAREYYFLSSSSPKILHFTGRLKPWNTPLKKFPAIRRKWAAEWVEASAMTNSHLKDRK